MIGVKADPSVYCFDSEFKRRVTVSYPLTASEGHLRLAQAVADRRFVVVLFTNRTGSNLITDMLDVLGCGGSVGYELFEVEEVCNKLATGGYVSLDDYVAAMIEARAVNGIFSFKIGWDALFGLSGMPILSALFERACFIWARRRDKVLQSISYMRAQRSGRFIEWVDAAHDPRPADLSDEDLPALVAQIHDQFIGDARLEYFLQLHGYWSRSLELTYEDIQADMQQVFRRVRSHISLHLDSPLPDVDFRPRLRKQSDGSERAIRNHLIDWMHGNGFMEHLRRCQVEDRSTADSLSAERDAPVMARNLTKCFWAPPFVDVDAFSDQLQTLLLPFGESGTYTGDNLVVFGRNLGFLRDEAFLRAFRRQIEPCNEIGYALLWRLHVLVTCAASGLRRTGDFVECGVLDGLSAAIMCETLDFGRRQKRSLFLYDTWGTDARVPDNYRHVGDMLPQVSARFAHYPNVRFVQGFIPESFSIAKPDTIAFLHVDLNSAEAEIATLDHLFHLVAPGGVVLFDDYGHNGYAASQAAEDVWMAQRGYRITELPTGQGLVIK